MYNFNEDMTQYMIAIPTAFLVARRFSVRLLMRSQAEPKSHSARLVAKYFLRSNSGAMR